MIPKIIVANKEDNIDAIIDQFATQHEIGASHRIVIKPEKDELTVEQIHLMQKDIQVIFSKLVLVVLREVDNSSIEVQNSLLKSLENDSDRILFLLLVKNPSRLLSTILSRCTIMNYKSNTHAIVGPEDYSNFFSFAKNSEVSKDMAIERIDRFIQSSSVRNQQILMHILQIRKLIVDNNVNAILALDHILIFLSKTSTMKVRHEK